MAFMYIRYICLFSFVHFTFFHVFHWCLSVSSLSFVFVSRSTFLTVKTKRYDLLACSEGVLRFLIWHYSHTLSTTIWNFMQLFHHHLLNQAIWLELVLFFVLCLTDNSMHWSHMKVMEMSFFFFLLPWNYVTHSTAFKSIRYMVTDLVLCAWQIFHLSSDIPMCLYETQAHINVKPALALIY